MDTVNFSRNEIIPKTSHRLSSARCNQLSETSTSVGSYIPFKSDTSVQSNSTGHDCRQTKSRTSLNKDGVFLPGLNEEDEFSFMCNDDDDAHYSSKGRSEPFVHDSSYCISSTPIVSCTQNQKSTCQTSVDENVSPIVCKNCLCLKEKLKFLTEVNQELKRLLVASLGNDLRLRIEQLVHEKAGLSCDLDRSLCHLADNMEDVDRISIDCDIWRSKFLASRLMIDELANLKAELSLHFAESQRALQCLLNERSELSDLLNDTNVKLKEVFQQMYMISTESDSEDICRVGNSLSATSIIKLHSSTRGTIIDVAQDTSALAGKLYDYYHQCLSKRPSNWDFQPSSTIQPTKGEDIGKKVLCTLPMKERAMNLPMMFKDLEFFSHPINQRNSPKCGFWLLGHQSSDISFHCNACKGPTLYI